MNTTSAPALLTHLRSAAAEDTPELAAELLRTATTAHGEHAFAVDEAVVQVLVDLERGPLCVAQLDLELMASLADRICGRLGESGSPGTTPEAEQAWRLLDALRTSRCLQRISASGTVDAWSQRILHLVERSHFSFGRLLAQRCDRYGSRELFILPDRRSLSFHQVWQRVELIGRGLLALTRDEPSRPVAILSRNRLEMALADFACLTSGIVNVMIPATATEADVVYILGHAGVGTVLAAEDDLVARATAASHHVPHPVRVLRIDSAAPQRGGVMSFEHLLDLANTVPAAEISARREGVSIDELATIMYTSGTTGTPKGIAFSHRNMIFKRFARALALPAIGDGDRFLSYLPLFHTFGRFLELQGAVFWGASYCFAENPGIDTLLRQMQELRPTIFISIPMKWNQLYEMVQQRIDLRLADSAEIIAITRQLTGGRLCWGLSAAGYLDPEVFRFFQAHGVELMSGFGMTEATGGITMTPPGQYRDDSLGVALPGIEIKLADDGELMIRGSFVMQGYYKPTTDTTGFDEAGWLHTGDLMEVDEAGHIHIVDRKKEIYKNVKGQTVAPQRIENLFRDFDSVGRIFLVGDHRPYNTALIYPNPDFEDLDFQNLSPDERKAHFRSLVVTANSFLAPFERIVDFAVINRDFSLDRDELTPKGTYRRKTIEKNFADTIRLLYRRTTVTVGGAELTVDNWLFQALGITAQDLLAEGEWLRLSPDGQRVTVRRESEDEIRIGSAVYRCTERSLSLGAVLSTPRLWLGNAELVDLAPLSLELRDRHRRREVAIDWQRSAADGREIHAEQKEAATALLRKQDFDLMDLHLAALLLDAQAATDADLAVRVLRHVVELEDGELVSTARTLLRRAATSASVEVARHAFQILAVVETPPHYRDTIGRFLDRQPGVLESDTADVLGEHDLTPERLAAFLEETETRCLTDADPARPQTVLGLLRLLARYGCSHPSQYQRLRAFCTRLAITAPHRDLRAAARLRRGELETGFRAWIGPPTRVAVDPETGFEYRWEDVVAYSDEVAEADRVRLIEALRSTALLREAVFLFSNGASVRLHDILPGGVWVRLLGTGHGRSVFRIAVRTRDRGIFDLAVNLNHDLSPTEIEEEVDWLILCGDPDSRSSLVEEFGGYWPEHGLWSEEFIAGETLDRALSRLAKRPEDDDRFTGVWPFAAWTAISRYVDFWSRTGQRLIITDPRPGNVIVPTHDYHTGARLVSIAQRECFTTLGKLLSTLYESFIVEVEALHPRLAGLVGWDTVFSALLEVVGEDRGLELLRSSMTGDAAIAPEVAAAAREFVTVVEQRGFLPMRLFFACKRFRRWQLLNPEATRFARARTLQEIYLTYDLGQLADAYPEARARFFRETVFRDCPQALADGLESIITALRSGELLPADLSVAVAELRSHLSSETEEDFFLARLSFPHLRPEHEASYVAVNAAEGLQSEMVVTLVDGEGDSFRVRHALSPKEVGRLHRLFLAAKLPVQFRPEHRFLVALNGRGHIIGGLFYELQPEDRNAHMDKVVVDEPFQRRGIAGALLDELCNRLITAGVRSLTTGFFRPQFFYRYGFTVERRYAGLVRRLDDTNGGDEARSSERPLEAL